jgi:hypothetical protein
MNPETGEIREFEDDIPEGWTGLEELEAGKEIELIGLRFKITASVIECGTPGLVSLTLEAIPRKTNLEKLLKKLTGTRYSPGKKFY